MSRVWLILMIVPFNEVAESVEGLLGEPPSYGMYGGGTLSSMHVPRSRMCVSTLDESNAFSYVRTPEWMWRWFACCPVEAGTVWSLLTPEQRAKVISYSRQKPWKFVISFDFGPVFSGFGPRE